MPGRLIRRIPAMRKSPTRQDRLEFWTIYEGTAGKYYDSTCRGLNFTTRYYNHNAPLNQQNITYV